LQAPVSVTEQAPGQVSALEQAPVSQQAAQEAAMQPVSSRNRKKKWQQQGPGPEWQQSTFSRSNTSFLSFDRTATSGSVNQAQAVG
jgi:hypothetical protein